MDTDLQAKEAPCLPAKKSFCLWLQGLLSESHFHLLGRWLSKGGRPNPMLRQNTPPLLHKEEAKNRGKKQFLNPISTKHKHLSQKSPWCWDTPEDSLLKQFPWLPEECTQWHEMTSAPWKISQSGSTSIPLSWVPNLVTSVHPNQGQLLHVDETKTWGQIMVYTCDKKFTWEEKERYSSWTFTPIALPREAKRAIAQSALQSAEQL